MYDANESDTNRMASLGRLTRRSVLGGALATSLALPVVRAAAQLPAGDSGIFVRSEETGGLTMVDPVTGAIVFTFATDGRPELVWPSLLPGVAFVRTDSSLALVDGNSGETRPIALPQDVATQILPSSIQFRGSSGTSKQLIGTPGSANDTYLVDLLTGERINVMGLVTANPPPVTLQNVALSADDAHMIIWDGRRTWIVELSSMTNRLLGTGQFTFSAGFTTDGSQIAWSQQLANGNTELHIQNADGSADDRLYESGEILVSLPIPAQDALLLDERSDTGGVLSVRNLYGTGQRGDILEYTGATNIVQFALEGQYALVGIEGESGRDWYRLGLKPMGGGALLLHDLADAEVQPGFSFHSDWAVASIGADDMNQGRIVAVDLVGGTTTVLIDGITTDAEVSPVTVAELGPGGLVTIDSFTELAVHLLNLEFGRDIAFDLMKGGSGVLAPAGDGCAVTYDRNTGGTTTIIYDRDGAEQASVPGTALGWIAL
jgi:hypothetical protein